MRQLWMVPLAAMTVATLGSPVRAQTPHAATGIEERLTRLDEGQRGLEKRLDDVNRRFDDVNRRFDDVNRRIDDLRADMNQRFAEVNQRFADVDKRFDDLNHRIGDVMTFLQILVGVLAAMAIGIFGTLLLMWRRLVKVEADVALLTNQSRLVRTP